MPKIRFFVLTLCMLFSLPSAFAAEHEEPRVHGLTEIIRSLAPIKGQHIATPAIDLDIRFEFDSAKLSPTAHHQLTELGKALTSDELRGIRIGIHGHTDATGNEAYNLHLSQRRAEAVAAYLVKHFAISSARFHAKGFGEQRPKNPTAPDAAANRRVEIVNLSATSVPVPPNHQKEAIRW